MAEISKIQLPSGGVYDIKDATAREMISGGVSFIVAWDGNSTPVVANIPEGVVVTYQETTYTGTLTAETTGPDPHAQAGAFYLVKSATSTTGGALDVYDEYVPVGTTGSKTWEKIGDTQVDLTDVVTGVTLNKQTDIVLGEATTFTNSTSSVSFSGGTTDKVLGEATTFALSSGAVTHGELTGHTDSVLGTSTTFTVTQPTISVTPTTTNIKATASGTAVGANGTAAAITGFGEHTTDTFVKSVSAETNKNLVTTTVPNVTGNTSVSVPNITGNTSATANKSTWTFTMGSGDAAETLIIGGGNGSDVTATNTVLGTANTATNTTLGTAITVATGATSTTGTGDAVVTGVTIGSSAAAITALGTPTTSNCLTGVKVTSQPTIALATGATAGTGVISVATGIDSASASGAAVSASGDNVNAIISMPTSTVGTSITVGTNDKVTAVTGIGTGTAAAQTITVGTNDKVTTLTNGTSITVNKGGQ